MTLTSPRTCSRLAQCSLALITLSLTAGSVPATPPTRDLARYLPVSATTQTSKPLAASAAVRAVTMAVRPRPNIVTVMSDDMRVDDLRFMPRVRRLVRGTGVEFKNSFSPYPLCCPARASFLTGVYAHHHKVLSHLSPYGFGSFNDSKTIATTLRRNGYNTGFVGKYLNGYGTMRSRVTGGPSAHYVPAGWVDWHGALEPAPGGGYSGGTYDYFDTPYNVNGRIEGNHGGEYQTNTLGRKTRHLIGKYARSRKPFFIYLSAVAPHFGLPYESGDPGLVRRADGKYTEFLTPARPSWVKGRFNKTIRRAPGYPKDGSASERNMTDKPGYLRQVPEANKNERRAGVNLTRQRAEALFVLDLEIGRTIAKLKKTGEWKNTVFMFTSDNGYFLGEHRVRQGKTKPHEPSLRVPFLITGPGIPHGQVRYDPITTIGITATIADYARVPGRTPYPSEGVSVRPSLVNGDRGWTRPVVYEAIIEGMARSAGSRRRGFTTALNASGIRTGRYKFIQYANGVVELYDLLKDPIERRSVHRFRAYRNIRADLHAIWWQYKNCKGSRCNKVLDVRYRVAPSVSRTTTNHQARAVAARYGR